MGFRGFLSHSTDASEQVIVWRPQTLAAAHGIELVVPPRPGLELPSGRRVVPSTGIRSAIEHSEFVLAIITARTSRFVEQELNYALGKRKLIIPIVETGVRNGAFLRNFPKVFWFSHHDAPGKVETEIVGFLKTQKVAKEQRQAIAALVGIGLGLLLLSALPTE